jgi:hypothetical protein
LIASSRTAANALGGGSAKLADHTGRADETGDSAAGASGGAGAAGIGGIGGSDSAGAS